MGAVRDLFAGEGEEREALSGVSFALEPGEVVGYIGPNGAGKSTTVKCLTGLLRPTGGRVRIDGMDPWRQRQQTVRKIGVVFGQRTQLWWDLAVQEAFTLLFEIFEVPKAVRGHRLSELATLLDLEPLLGTPVRQLSLGQRMRCDLAAALLHRPQLLLLDEPTIGLDAEVKSRVRVFIRRLAVEGVAVLLTTHDLSDIEQLTDRVLLLSEGRIVFRGSLTDLRSLAAVSPRITLETRSPLSVETLAGHPVRRTGPHRGELLVPLGQPTAPLIEALLKEIDVRDLRIQDPPIEEVIKAFYAKTRQ